LRSDSEADENRGRCRESYAQGEISVGDNATFKSLTAGHIVLQVDGVTRCLARLLAHLREQGHEAVVLGPQSGMVRVFDVVSNPPV
jgi:hypothetical protein